MSDVRSAEKMINDVAKACHEANKVLCEGLVDFSQKHWDEAEEWQLDSAIKGVEYFIINPDAPDSAQHDAWVDDKIADGWVFGEDKNTVSKTHPCLVAFDQLSVGQQAKDALFKAVCKTLVPLIDKS